MGGADLALLAYGALVLFIVLDVTVEAVVMLLMKYNPAKKAFLDSFVVNIVSLVAGVLLFSIAGDIHRLVTSAVLNWFLLYAMTVVIEFLLLYLLNRKKQTGKTFLTCTAMNIVSYLILILVGVGR